MERLWISWMSEHLSDQVLSGCTVLFKETDLQNMFMYDGTDKEDFSEPPADAHQDRKRSQCNQRAWAPPIYIQKENLLYSLNEGNIQATKGFSNIG